MSSSRPLDEQQRDILRGWVGLIGEKPTARKYGISPHTLARAIAGLDLSRDTLGRLKERLV